jgi:BASS family bile acid:Na+ symporter
MRHLELLPWALLLNFLAMAAGFFFARSVKCKNKNNFTISIQVGMQNSALAIYVAANLLNNKPMAVVAVVYSSFTFFSTMLFGYIGKKYGERF